MKKTISILMCFCMLISTLVFTQTSASAESYTSGDFEYEILDDCTAEITEYNGSAVSLEIPSEINGYTVTSIGYGAFNDCTSLESITIGNGVTNIGRYAFYNTAYYNNQSNWEDNVLYIGEYLIDGKYEKYNNETDEYETVIEVSGSYSIKEGTKAIAEYAFNDCTSLESITIPDSVTSIGDWAFEGCTSLTNITISNSVTSIGWSVFNGCTSLTSVTIPNSVTSIGYGAFDDCSALSSIVVDSNNKVYDSRDNCNAIINTENNELIAGCKNTIIPNSVTSIGDWAFSGCSSLPNITIPNSVTSIGDWAFSGCSSLPNITIPDSVISIGDSTFWYCTALKSITIPDSVTSIGINAFKGCTALKSITIPDSVTSIGWSAFDGCKSLKSVTIGNSVTSIGDEAFKDCSSLTSITIPNSVTSIGYSAFSGCTSLTSITIPDSVTSIGDSTFSYCTSLESITIGNSVTSIGDSTFSYCTSLESITIGNSVTSIGSYAFYNTAYYNNKSNWEDNVLYIGEYLIDGKYEKYNYETDKYDTFEVSGSYSIKEGTKVIAHSAFEDCTSLTSITLPNSVTSIGGWAFSGCSSLTSITIPNSVTSIGKGAFWGCTSLTSITIPNSVTSISGCAFQDCELLESITIGNGITSIDDRAFEGCTSLTNIAIPDSVTSIGMYAFYNTAYYNNKSNWADNVLYIGNYLISGKYQIYNEDIWDYETVFEATGTYSIKEGTKTIADCAFSGCESLESITIPDSVTYIGDYALGYYNNNDWGYEKVVQGFTITGYTGSEAEKYANDNSFEFISLGDSTNLTNPEQSTNPSTQPTTATTPSTQTTQPSTNTQQPTTSTVKPTTPTKPVVAKQTLKTPKVKYTSGKKQIKIKYTKVKNAVGFQVRYRIKGKWKIKTFNTKKSVTKTIKKLKKDKYKIQIRAFTKGKKQFSKWSKVKTVKVK